jgi:hypothetical protein
VTTPLRDVRTTTASHRHADEQYTSLWGVLPKDQPKPSLLLKSNFQVKKRRHHINRDNYTYLKSVCLFKEDYNSTKTQEKEEKRKKKNIFTVDQQMIVVVAFVVDVDSSIAVQLIVVLVEVVAWHSSTTVHAKKTPNEITTRGATREARERREPERVAAARQRATAPVVE